MTHVCRIGLALDDVEDGDVAAALARVRRDHAVLGLQQAAHDVEHSCLAHRLGRLCVVAREGRVRRHEEVAARDGYQDHGRSPSCTSSTRVRACCLPGAV